MFGFWFVLISFPVLDLYAGNRPFLVIQNVGIVTIIDSIERNLRNEQHTVVHTQKITRYLLNV